MLHLEVATKKMKFRVCACQWLGPSIIAKLHIKNGAMLYIKVLLWTPSECMQRGALKRRKEKWKLMSYYCSQMVLLPKDVGHLNPNILFANSQQPLKLVCQLWFIVQRCDNMSVFSKAVKMWTIAPNTFTLLGGRLLSATNKGEMLYFVVCFPKLHHWDCCYIIKHGNFHFRCEIAYLISSGVI